MQTEHSPSLTRLDAMQWFLRVQLWLSVVMLIFSFIQPYMFLALGSLLQNLMGYGIPVLILSIFPNVLATSALGYSAREPLTSLVQLRSLVWRCVGLTLFAQTLGRAVIFSFYVVYSLIPNVSSAWLFGTGTSATFVRFQIITTALQFLLGFILAFGPAIRDNFRAR